MSTLSLRGLRCAMTHLQHPASGNLPVVIISRGVAAQAVEAQEKPARMKKFAICNRKKFAISKQKKII